MATMLAAVFAAVLAAAAYATGSHSPCDSRTYGSRCKAEGTKFHDLNGNGKRDSGEPGLAGTLAGPQKVAGDDDSSLEPDELWRYTCTHRVTASDPDPLPNTVRVTGKDPLGGTVEDEDSATVDIIQPAVKQESAPPPAQQVLAAQQARPRRSRGRARLRGPSGCVYRTFRANVSGRQIRRVTFFVDGRRVAVRRARNGQRTFTARVTPGRLSLGVHRVTARVVFRSASRTRPRTLVLSFQRCGQQAPSPRFTG